MAILLALIQTPQVDCNFIVGVIQLEILMVIRLATIQPATISSTATMDLNVHSW